VIEKVETDYYQLVNDDCFKVMENIPDKTINLIATDLPYGVTKNKWDSVVDLDTMWKEFERITTDNGSVVLTSTFQFAIQLVQACQKNCKNLKFRYDLIWEKTISSGQLNIRRQPLRNHEYILVFQKSKPVYNEQKTIGDPYKIKRQLSKYASNYNTQKDNIVKDNNGYRHAKSVLKISNPRIRGGHPTQKPAELMSHIVKCYSNSGDIVFDCCMGSGTTGVSCLENDRKFIGSEIDSKYFDRAKNRLNSLYNEKKISKN